MSQWIKFPPRDGTPVLLDHPEFGVVVGVYDDATGDWWAASPREFERGWFSLFMDGETAQDPDYWMPVPQAPEDAA